MNTEQLSKLIHPASGSLVAKLVCETALEEPTFYVDGTAVHEDPPKLRIGHELRDGHGSRAKFADEVDASHLDDYRLAAFVQLRVDFMRSLVANGPFQYTSKPIPPAKRSAPSSFDNLMVYISTGAPQIPTECVVEGFVAFHEDAARVIRDLVKFCSSLGADGKYKAVAIAEEFLQAKDALVEVVKATEPSTPADAVATPPNAAAWPNLDHLLGAEKPVDDWEAWKGVCHLLVRREDLLGRRVDLLQLDGTWKQWVGDVEGETSDGRFKVAELMSRNVFVAHPSRLRPTTRLKPLAGAGEWAIEQGRVLWRMLVPRFNNDATPFWKFAEIAQYMQAPTPAIFFEGRWYYLRRIEESVK